MIYETDTNRVLVWDNSAWVMIADTDTPPALELVKTQTIGSAVSSVTVSNCFSSTYDNYRILITGGTTSTQSNLGFQLSGITGSVYNQLGYYQLWGASTRYDYAAQSTNVIIADGSATAYSADVELKNPYASVRKFGNTNSQSTNNQYAMPFYINSTTSATGFTITPGSGTMTGGTITVYGYRNAI
jgi:hypothetical protein